jgi:hypothetical protein
VSARAQRRRGLFATVATLLVLTSAADAGWRDDASPSDVQRLDRLTESRAKGLLEAQSAKPSDLAAIKSILQAGVVSNGRIAGTWKCRTMKLGGLTPAIVYSWFTCRISERGGRLFFEKLGGSQRTSGYLYPDAGGYVYLGASYVHYNGANEKPPVYSSTGASAGASQTPDDQIGLFSLTYDGRARLELPYPVQESTYDVIELKR